MSDKFKSERDLMRNKLRGIFEHRYTYLCDLEVEGWRTKEPVSYEDRKSGEYIKINIGDSWGERWDCAWFHVTGTVPEEAAGKSVIVMIDLSGEGCVFNDEGTPVQGLTLGRRHRVGEILGAEDKTIIKVTDNAKGSERIDLWIDAGCNNLFGHYVDNGRFKFANISVLNANMNQLYYDFQVLKSLFEQLSEDKAQRQSIINVLVESAHVLNKYTEDEAAAAREILAAELAKQGGTPSLRFTAVGHAHLDLAWLWPIRESKRKAARTFASALRYMEEYPDYCFGQSQPQQFKWIKEEHAALYEEIKARVKEGRLEVQGGMWVEADTNVAGGEALIRQFLYGKRFFKQEFDKDVKVLWLPDVFGYNAALPQIMKKSGIDYFMTIKLSWSKINDFPYHTFNWKGLGNFEVLSHMPPEGNYGSWAEPRNLTFAEKNFHEKGISDEALILFGASDGGGGPGEDHLEAARRLKNINGLCPMKQEPAINFFERINKNKDKYPKWHGELYLEYHQGTYTTQGRNKLYNRKMELALREAEFACCMAMRANSGEFSYPQAKLDEIWEEVLLYQFHDILPGSSIKRVYDESMERYMILFEEVKGIIDSAYDFIAGALTDDSGSRDIAVFNSLSWEREEWINTASGWIKIKIPALGYHTLGVGDAQNSGEIGGVKAYFSKENKTYVLENQKIKAVINDKGHVVSLFDQATKKEWIAPNVAANRLVVYNDPGDAWDFSLHYRDEVAGEFSLTGANAYTDGPNAVLELDFVYGDSVLKQKLSLQADGEQLKFECFADWNESAKMLRAEMPFDIYSDEVRCNIQFGNVARPTHNSTSWDYAKYEICAQKWIDISNRSHGVAILNDCKYGYGVNDNNISINLLRSPSHPDECADRGVHVFSYSIYPHKGDYFEGTVDKKGYEFNIKPEIRQPDSVMGVTQEASVCPACNSYVGVESDSGSVMVEAVKKAEDSCDMVIRLYEYAGFAAKAQVCVKGAKAAFLTDMLENELQELAVTGGSFEVMFSEFEIQTVKVKF